VKREGAAVPDKLVHERARLRILVLLASSMEPETGFTTLRDGLSLTGGNLSTQLKTLEQAGYVTMSKRFVGSKPFTGVSLTLAGKKALDAYLEEMESILAALKGAGREKES
jgi:DNA-binding MarR family transcriptional regulator